MISGEIQVGSAQRSGAGTAHESTRWALRQAVGRPRLRPVRGAPSWAQLLTLAVVVVLAQGCAGIPERNPVPAIYSAIAEVPGLPEARFWGDETSPDMKEWFAESKAHMQARYPAIMGRKHNYLALSGGGQDGAFGAGVLVGWTAAGTRPEFTLVTGVSTGALIAPFAFLGSEYDTQLRDLFTKYSTKDLLKKRNILMALLASDATASSAPLKALIAKHVDQNVLEEIAIEFRKGRMLYIGTTNLDADRPVMWNIARIAASRVPNALELVQDIILASASIPAVFPPVIFEVEAKGQRYDELHVDGGVTSQVFLYPLGLDWRRVTEKLDAKGRPSVYLIRNAKLDPTWKAVERRLRPVAGRSIAALIRTQGIGDMYRIYVGAQRDGVDYNLAYIPPEFKEESKEMFDPEYMGKLFDLGNRMATAGFPWKDSPPGTKAP
ncbi:MAG: patatin-like phospholipase family protein [Acidiferrobacterales bacterium]